MYRQEILEVLRKERVFSKNMILREMIRNYLISSNNLSYVPSFYDKYLRHLASIAFRKVSSNMTEDQVKEALEKSPYSVYENSYVYDIIERMLHRTEVNLVKKASTYQVTMVFNPHLFLSKEGDVLKEIAPVAESEEVNFLWNGNKIQMLTSYSVKCVVSLEDLMCYSFLNSVIVESEIIRMKNTGNKPVSPPIENNEDN